MLYDLLAAPFVDYQFMRRALVGALALALAGSPLGVFLVLRRMSLAGDALSHAILPGAAMGYLVAGLSLPAMTLRLPPFTLYRWRLASPSSRSKVRMSICCMYCSARPWRSTTRRCCCSPASRR